MTWRHVHILFDTYFAYQYRSLSLIQIEESLNRAVDRISKLCELLAQGTGKGCCMVHIDGVRARHGAQSFSGRNSGQRWALPVTVFRWRSSPSPPSKIKITSFSPAWYVTCLLLAVFRCAAESSQARTATRFLSSLCWMRTQLPPLRSWSWSGRIMDQNCKGILPVVHIEVYWVKMI